MTSDREIAELVEIEIQECGGTEFRTNPFQNTRHEHRALELSRILLPQIKERNLGLSFSSIVAVSKNIQV